MTLAHACLMLPDLGFQDLQIHRDHLCHAEHSHKHGECPYLSAISLSAADLAPLATRDDLLGLLVAMLQRDADEGTCIECGCSELSACEDDGSGEPCHWVSRDPPICSTCAPVVPDCALAQRWPWSTERRP
jgi:hypothetical protein